MNLFQSENKFMVTYKALRNVQIKILKNAFPEGLSSSQKLAWRTQICPPENSPNILKCMLLLYSIWLRIISEVRKHIK